MIKNMCAINVSSLEPHSTFSFPMNDTVSTEPLFFLQDANALFECISQSLMNAVDRDAVSGWGAVVTVM